jgi:hypothetical protein
MRITSFLCRALYPTGKNFLANGTKFPSMEHDALTEALGGSIMATWNRWGFHKTVDIVFWKQRSCFRLRMCFHLMLSIFDLGHKPEHESRNDPTRSHNFFYWPFLERLSHGIELATFCERGLGFDFWARSPSHSIC